MTDNASHDLAHKYFADHLEPDLHAKGIPYSVINWMRDGFVQGSDGHPEASRYLRDTPPAVGRCGDPDPTITSANLPPVYCALPHGHAGWNRADEHVPTILAAVDNALRNGSHMTGANLAFDMLCDRLGVDRDRLVFQPDWAATVRTAEHG